MSYRAQCERRRERHAKIVIAHSACYVLEGRKTRRTRDLLKSAAFYESGKRFIAHTHVGDREVSTIFLAFDHGHGGRVVLFESAIGYRGKWDPQDRASTWKRAMRMHHRIVDALRAELRGQEAMPRAL